jgi:hypothetical protein
MQAGGQGRPAAPDAPSMRHMAHKPCTLSGPFCGCPTPFLYNNPMPVHPGAVLPSGVTEHRPPHPPGKTAPASQQAVAAKPRAAQCCSPTLLAWRHTSSSRLPSTWPAPKPRPGTHNAALTDRPAGPAEASAPQKGNAQAWRNVAHLRTLCSPLPPQWQLPAPPAGQQPAWPQPQRRLLLQQRARTAQNQLLKSRAK